MRKVRHKNVVQFIGACTRKPNLCIVFEYMSGGSLYDYVRRVSAALPLLLPWQLCWTISCCNMCSEYPSYTCIPGLDLGLA